MRGKQASIRRPPFLKDAQIERDAMALLEEFSRARGIEVRAPVPIEDIAEKYLKLGLEFDNLERRFGHAPPHPGARTDILGAIFFEDRRVVIDESLDPDSFPQMIGPFRFTLAHEAGGHWRLHRSLFERDPAQAGLFEETALPSVVCRSSQRRAPVEWQADRYAAYLLMPRPLVLEAWRDMFPDGKPRLLRPRSPTRHSLVEIPWPVQGGADSDNAGSGQAALEHFSRPLAKRFLVSPIAMRIRLQQLGLLFERAPEQLALSGSC